MNIKIDANLDPVLDYLGSIAPTVERLVAERMDYIVRHVEQYTITNKLSGQVLNQRTGHLAASMNHRVDKSTNEVTGTISNSASYARILEEGGRTSAHMITATRAEALRFIMNGNVVFRKSVNHPGSLIPAFRYMASALEDNNTWIKDQVLEAVRLAINQ